jgi:acyl dehydratase
MSSPGEERLALAALTYQVGARIGTTEWKRIDQFEEDLFATLIGDFDPMHNETGWGASVGLGGAVVLGAHVMSLLPTFLREHGLPVRSDESVSWRPLRLGRVRIPISLPVGARFRAHTDLLEMKVDGDSFVLTTSHRIDVENEEKPFMVISEFVSVFNFND